LQLQLNEARQAAILSTAAKHVVQVQAKKFAYRLSYPYCPLKEKQDRHFPAIDKLNYNNYLVAVYS
jgi:hypothetical protein